VFGWRLASAIGRVHACPTGRAPSSCHADTLDMAPAGTPECDSGNVGWRRVQDGRRGRVWAELTLDSVCFECLLAQQAEHLHRPPATGHNHRPARPPTSALVAQHERWAIVINDTASE
jgi:hypothetical protein